MNKNSAFIKIKFLIFFLALIVSACAEDVKTPSNIKNCSATTSLTTSDNNLFDSSRNLDSNPLYVHQWHLKNTAQSAFANNPGRKGIDLRLDGVSQTGRGVVVNIVDTGLEICHEDLSDNIVRGSVNFLNNSNDPTNTKDQSGDHGTSVAGLIAAKANNVGGIGVAPDASIIAHNYLAAQSAANFITSMLANADIVNQSFGKDNTDDIRVSEYIINAYKNGVTNKRNLKGIVYIKSAGNDFQKEETNISCRAGLTCHNANMDPVHTYPYNIVVAAINAQGKRSSYSTAGSAILISGFGGEAGRKYPAMITTDQSGCNQGYARRNSSRITTRIPNNLDKTCNYTSTFNGTSSAAPVIAGVVALMLEANPKLTWRDIRHILVNTARKIDPNRDTLYYHDIATGDIPEIKDATIELGWTTNKAGLEFHNWYGFGLVDASIATTMARDYNANRLGNFKEIATDFYIVGQPIPDQNVTGVMSEIEFIDDLTIESIQIDLQITHPFVADLGIFLESPQGTTSLLLNFANAFGDTDNLNMLLASQAFYGEQAHGTWRLKIIDYAKEDTGTLKKWNLKIYGH